MKANNEAMKGVVKMMMVKIMMMMFRMNSPKGKSIRGRFKGECDREMGT